MTALPHEYEVCYMGMIEFYSAYHCFIQAFVPRFDHFGTIFRGTGSVESYYVGTIDILE